jgi:hypothetical protein
MTSDALRRAELGAMVTPTSVCLISTHKEISSLLFLLLLLLFNEPCLEPLDTMFVFCGVFTFLRGRE